MRPVRSSSYGENLLLLTVQTPSRLAESSYLVPANAALISASAVAFTTLGVAFVPALAAVLVPFALSVAASRVVLGLHYPSDVLVGAALGAGLAAGSLALLP